MWVKQPVIKDVSQSVNETVSWSDSASHSPWISQPFNQSVNEINSQPSRISSFFLPLRLWHVMFRVVRLVQRPHSNQPGLLFTPQARVPVLFHLYSIGHASLTGARPSDTSSLSPGHLALAPRLRAAPFRLTCGWVIAAWRLSTRPNSEPGRRLMAVLR